jgi:hypothetical protein
MADSRDDLYEQYRLKDEYNRIEARRIEDKRIENNRDDRDYFEAKRKAEQARGLEAARAGNTAFAIAGLTGRADDALHYLALRNSGSSLENSTKTEEKKPERKETMVLERIDTKPDFLGMIPFQIRKTLSYRLDHKARPFSLNPKIFPPLLDPTPPEEHVAFRITNVSRYWELIPRVSEEAYNHRLISKIAIKFNETSFPIEIRCDGPKEACEAFEADLKSVIDDLNAQPSRP